MFSTDDTITAIATPAGRGGIGVVRISGPRALEITRGLTDHDSPLGPRIATFATLRDRQTSADQPIDQVICTYFPGPRSYTGEDVVEISAHGSPVVLARIIDAATTAGARLARPGEFTFRAYLNGRLDLVQAEAVADLIDAVTPMQARAAFAQLDGSLTERLRELRGRVFDLLVRLEACLDFPEEGYHFITRPELLEGLDGAQQQVLHLLTGAQRGRVIREGALVALVGRPNVGKSSLFNALVGSGRAIVTASPGTTRDLLTERCDISGVPVTFVDTAGVREARDEVEREGVARARQATDVASLRLLVLDLSSPLTDEDRALVAGLAGRPSLIVCNKSDVPSAWRVSDVTDDAGDDAAFAVVSARTGVGLDELRAAIYRALTGSERLTDEGARVTNVRHARLLEEAGAALRAARQGAGDGASEEFVIADLGVCIRLFDQIMHHGASDPEAVLATVFSRFCIGK